MINWKQYYYTLLGICMRYQACHHALSEFADALEDKIKDEQEAAVLRQFLEDNKYRDVETRVRIHDEQA